MNFRSRLLLLCYPLLFACLVSAQSRRRAHESQDAGYRLPYDTATLAVDGSGPILLPYNRRIDPAGKVLRFGDPALENHSLDAVLLSGGILAVEDRYGVAFVRVPGGTLAYHLDFGQTYRGCMSTYSGIKTFTDPNGGIHVLWSASSTGNHKSYLFDALWNGQKAEISKVFTFEPQAPSPLALPNEVAVQQVATETYIYVVLNGNDRLVKLRWSDGATVWSAPTGMAPYGVALVAGKLYVSNWAGPVPTDTLNRQTAGIPYGRVYVDPRTGATAMGSVSVFDTSGQERAEIQVGLHPNALKGSGDGRYVFVCDGNSDEVSVLSTDRDRTVDSFPVRLHPLKDPFIGDTPDGLVLDSTGKTLYVSLGMDNAVAVVQLDGTKGRVKGFIPTEAYPAGLVLDGAYLYVCNLEGESARVPSGKQHAFNSHHQDATLSVIPVPDSDSLASYTKRVEAADFIFREALTRLLPRKNVAPKPVPDRIGEPSVFKHVIYIIKENRTYDQVLGDLPEGDGMPSLCMYGDSITPNQHALTKDFLLLDNYYASGKCSAEGHQWTDAGMVSDYVEKNVRAWFRSYPHVQTDALVYDKEGFIWNDALDHGKTVRIYGEACTVHVQGAQDFKDIFAHLSSGDPLKFHNVTTISRVEPILDTLYPGFDGPNISDQFRANAFIAELGHYERLPGDQWPDLMVLALPNDHTVGTRPGEPTPESMVADNDLALGRIVDAVSHSRFWDSTVIFVTEDDSQAGWDHVSAYRTTGFVISPYSRLRKTVHTNFNQVSLLMTVEQILGIPPMNALDATALPMADCFSASPDTGSWTSLSNRIPIDRMNPDMATLKGKARFYARMSATPQYDHIDGGDDDLLNHILWYAAMGDKPYPAAQVLPARERKHDED